MNLRAGSNKISLLSVAVGLPVSTLDRLSRWRHLYVRIIIVKRLTYLSFLNSFSKILPDKFVFVLENVGGHYESWSTGVLGPVALLGLDRGKQDLSWAKWTYQVFNYDMMIY